ncbi:MAG: murein hydrolase activator EnvC family protein [Lachnospiraceae bacterium]
MRKVLSFMLIGLLVLSITLPVQADTIEEKKQQAEELEDQKKAAETEQAALNEELSGIIAEMKQTEENLTNKRLEIQTAEEELDEAKINENEQYEAMKLRIKFMYENGNAEYFEILCEAESITDLLNKAEYISKISECDRDLLVQFQDLVKQVEEKEAALKEEEEELQTLQTKLVEQQAQAEQLLASKNIEIANLQEAIGENATELQALINEANEAAKRQAEAAAAVVNASSAGSSVISGSGVLSHPCPGYSRISSGFGYRDAPTAGASTFHGGLDFAASSGTPVYAAEGGTVTTSRFSSTAGNYIIINHGDGMQTVYMHMSALYVSEGATVSQGQNIGAVGTTGVSTGPHLHFEVRMNGTKVDPSYYL